MEFSDSITKIEECLSDNDKWMSLSTYSQSIIQTIATPSSLWNWDNQALTTCKKHWRYLRYHYVNASPCKQCKSAFYYLRTISRIRKYLSTQATAILIHAFVTSQLDHCNSLLYNVPKNVIKSFNRCRMQLPEWLHGLGSGITSLPSSSIFTAYLFLNELNSRFYYLPSKVCSSNLQPTFKTLSPATYPLDRFGHPLRSVWILLALTLRPVDLEHFLSQPPNFGTNYLTTYAHARM